MSKKALFWAGFLFEAGFFAAALLLAKLFRIDLFDGWSTAPSALLQVAAGTAFLLILYVLLSRSQAKPCRDLRRITAFFVRTFFTSPTRPDAISPSQPWRRRLESAAVVAKMFLLAAAAGIGEEALFRGFLQTGALVLGERAGLTEPAAVFAALTGVSLLFGAVHALTPFYFLLAAGMGAFFGILFLRTGNLFVPAAIHFLYDFCVLLDVSRRMKIRRENHKH